jgi:hypothetical protein
MNRWINRTGGLNEVYSAILIMNISRSLDPTPDLIISLAGESTLHHCQTFFVSNFPITEKKCLSTIETVHFR